MVQQVRCSANGTAGEANSSKCSLCSASIQFCTTLTELSPSFVLSITNISVGSSIYPLDRQYIRWIALSSTTHSSRGCRSKWCCD
jgi:hypothetical protein